jgi:eukaryotic-like serine/threonine-protein kinase
MNTEDLYPFPLLQDLEGLYDEVLEKGTLVNKEKYNNPNYKSRYFFVRKIGEGGIKKVSLETDICTNREVAVYRLLKKSAENETSLLNEAHNTAILEHNNILPVYDFGMHEGEFYYTSKYLDGKSFKNFLTDEYSLSFKLSVILKVCDAMNYAHNKGIIHLDLKPVNIHLTSYNQVMVIDWGLSRDLSKTDFCFDDEIFSGTPGYCSPEQVLPAEVNYQADVYALGAILYEVLCGSPPWTSGSAEECIKKTVIGDVAELEEKMKQKDVADSLISVCLKAINAKLEDRYATVLDFQNDVLRYQKGFTTKAEDATYLKQFIFLLKRHKNVFLGCLILAFSIGFLIAHFHQELKINNQNIARLSKVEAEALYNESVWDFKNLELQQSHDKVLASLKLNQSLHARLHLAKVLLSFGKENECRKVLIDLRTSSYAKELIAIIDMDLNFGGFFKQLLLKKRIYLARNMVNYKHSQIAEIDGKIAFSKDLFASLGLRGLKYEISQKDGELRLMSASNLYRSLPVVGLPFTYIDFSNNPLSSIESLRGMKSLKYLNLKNTFVRDLTPLEGLELDYLNISDSCAVELRDLEKTYVKILDISGLKVRYLLTLKDMRNIEKIIVNKENMMSFFDQKAFNLLSSQNRIILN